MQWEAAEEADQGQPERQSTTTSQCLLSGRATTSFSGCMEINGSGSLVLSQSKTQRCSTAVSRFALTLNV